MIEDDVHVLLPVLRGLASRLIMAAPHRDCRAQPGARCGCAPQGAHGVQRVAHQALARSRALRTAPTLHHMVRRTLARGVCHTHCHTQLLRPPWPSMRAEIGMGRVAAAPVAPPSERGRLRITPRAEAMPRPATAVTGHLAGVRGPAQVQRPTGAAPIVKTVREQPAIGPAGTSRSAGTQGRRPAHATGPTQLAPRRLRCGVHRHRGRPSAFRGRAAGRHPLARRLARRRVTAGAVLRQRASPQVWFRPPVPKHRGTSRRSPGGQGAGTEGRSQSGAHDLCVVGSAGRPCCHDRPHIWCTGRAGQAFLFRPAPGRRPCPSAGSWGNASRAASPRAIVRREPPTTAARARTPPEPNGRAGTAAKRRRSFADKVS
jgi:hypothetical protein